MKKGKIVYLCYLSTKFFTNYSPHLFPEILRKKNRPYSCLAFKLSSDIFICIPYRTKINHKYAYHFKNSQRSKLHKSGLDYTKMVILCDESYLNCSRQVLLDADEYVETVRNVQIIRQEATGFLNQYIAHVTGQKLLHSEEFKRRYQYSPLKYFHKELGITSQASLVS